MKNLFFFSFFIFASFESKSLSQTNSSANAMMTTFFIPPDIMGICWESQSGLFNDVYSSDNAYVYSSSLSSGYDCELAVNGLGFSIPSTAVIKGIEVRMERRAFGSVYEGQIRINNTGESRSTSAFWTSSDQIITFGGPTDLWGQTFTPAAINIPAFQIRFGVSVSNSSAAYIDQVQMIVYYDNPMPVTFMSLENFSSATSNTLIWKTSSEINSGHFDVEKSVDGFLFESIGTINASTNSEEVKTYRFEDFENDKEYFYRIKETDLDGSIYYSGIIFSSKKKGGFKVFPTLLDKEAFVFINVNEPNQETELMLTDLRGEKIYNEVFQSENLIHKIYFPGLEGGTYFLKIKSRSATEVFRLFKP